MFLPLDWRSCHLGWPPPLRRPNARNLLVPDAIRTDRCRCGSVHAVAQQLVLVRPRGQRPGVTLAETEVVTPATGRELPTIRSIAAEIVCPRLPMAKLGTARDRVPRPGLSDRRQRCELPPGRPPPRCDAGTNLQEFRGWGCQRAPERDAGRCVPRRVQSRVS